MMGKYLLALSGARSDILDQCDTERLKFHSLGWAILITSVMATVSMWFALTSVMGLNPFGSFFIALIWGLIILGIDRWLVTSMPSDGSRRWPIAVPRIILAVLLGSLISTPLVLRIFQSEINAQISVIKQERASTFLAQQQSSAVNQQVTYWSNNVSNLQKVIDSGGSVPLNPSADPQVQSLTRQKTAALALQHQYYQQWQCQLYGGSDCTVKGNGPLAKASHQSYLQAMAQVTNLDNQIQQREAALQATDKASEHSRYQQAVNALPNAKAQLTNAQNQLDTLRNNFDTTNNATNGLLIRLQALNELSDKDFTLNSVRFLLFLLFLVIECLPVTVKLMQRPGTYERLLAQRAEQDFKEAKRAMRAQSRSHNATALSTVPLVDNGARASVGEIWESRTKVLNVPPGWEGPEESEYIDRSDESEEETRLDAAIREMDDIHAVADADGRRGGIELRYGDDDL